MSYRDKRRKFGQNYLIDPAILYEMEQSINPQPNEQFVEIGPGTGALTSLLNKDKVHITAIDIDQENITYLLNHFKGPASYSFIQGDILKNDFEFLSSGDSRIAGNLPYNISTQIILKLIQHYHNIQDMHFLVQKEVAEKITGVPGTKNWGKLGIKLAAFFRTEMLFDVPPEAFDIQPKVTSSFIRMTPLPNKLIQASEMKKFFEVIDLSFMSRRKNINNNLKKMDLDWEKLGINNQLRPEDLDLESYIKILDEVIDK
ncbi:16S rRNA (adenine(1518)-N(6)/adenine(1519)-N(6))-dimethyltransferase RsmA [Gammaproteobacteria bacterium]|nr:16S rRNA (adenine(1518)-N(6)/adenine(1519)-N(6))-dimethyltransferase RsmA [Gammaproteobacteria bacterium]